MSGLHLKNNAQIGNFESAIQVFLNHRNGEQGFQKSEELENLAFENVIKILKENLYLSELTISNFKKIIDLNISLHKNLTVLIGENGVGKTSLLEAIRKNLMWIAATARKDNTSGGLLDREEVNNTAKIKNEGAYIDCEFQIGPIYKLKGRVARAPDGEISDLQSELTKYREFGKNLRILNRYKNIDLPLFSFYGVDRLQKGGKKLKNFTFGKIDGYDDSLKSKSSFDVFLEWTIQLLKLSKREEIKDDKSKIQEKIESLLEVGANDESHPLYELYDDLVTASTLYPQALIKHKAQKNINDLEELFKKVYPDLIELKLINEDDGIDKVAIQVGKEEIFLHQFSDGQRVLFGLLGDIARRLILLNDAAEEPFKGQGIVLIDEIELHLHPSWQQRIVLILRKSFPNIQFIVTTHSPHVITTVEPECIRSIYIDAETKKFKYDIPTFTKGAESNVVLENVFDVDPRPEWLIESTEWLKKYTDLVNKDLWDSDEAIDLRKKLDAWGKNKEMELDKLDVEISLRSFKRSKK
ncbi:AAA family ATPase [Acinetobacter lactucae]